MPLPSESASEFHLEEYKCIITQISEFAAERRRLEQSTLLASAAVFAWLATSNIRQSVSEFESFAWWIPFVLSSFGVLRNWSTIKSIFRREEYLLVLEKAFSSTPDLGWTRHRKAYQGDLSDFIRFRRSTSFSFWIALNVINLSMAVAMTLSATAGDPMTPNVGVK